MILPYLDDKNDSFNQKNITDVQNLIESTDLSGKAKFCNYIYDHNFVKEAKFSNENKLKKLELKSENEVLNNPNDKLFAIKYYENLTYFIIDIFIRIRYKFYINWINAFPSYNENL